MDEIIKALEADAKEAEKNGQEFEKTEEWYDTASEYGFARGIEHALRAIKPALKK